MKEFSAKRKWYNIQQSWWFSLVLLCLTLVLSISAIRMYAGYRYAKRHVAERVAEHDQLLQKKLELEENVKKLSTPEGLEEVLREKYRAVKEGEELVVILDEPK